MRLNVRTAAGLLFVMLVAGCVATGAARAAEYLAFDLESGEVAQLNTAPLDLLTNDAYRSTKMAFRRIPAGTFRMNGGRFEVTHTRDYYIAVFQCTQAQWELIAGNNPSRYRGALRPVESVSYSGQRAGSRSMVRGGQWPNGEPDANSFMGMLRAKFGGENAFDLPTEAQWEYAARAGTVSALNNGEDLSGEITCDRLAELGRYYFNRNDGLGGEGFTTHTTVGSYKPNAWGLYDMHGNVWEWCRDWWWAFPAGPAKDYEGFAHEVGGRVLRGGGWDNYAWFSIAESRDEGGQTYLFSSSVGFRVALEVE